MEIVMYLAACCTIATTVLALCDRTQRRIEKRKRKMMPGNENDQAGTWPF